MSNDSVNLFALTANPQTDYQTNLAGSSVTKVHRQIEKSDRQFANYSVQTSNNAGSSTGTPYKTRVNIESHDVAVSMTEDVSSQLLGERARGAMGLVASTEVDDDVSWQHEFTMLNPQDNPQLPAYGYAEKDGESGSRANAQNVAFPSMVFDQWSVKGEGKSIIKSTSQLVGSGKRTSPSGITFFGGSSQVILLEAMIQNYFRNTSAKLKLYPQTELGGSVVNVNCDFRDFECSINWNLKKDAGYLGCGLFQTTGDDESGSIRGKCEVGDPTVQFNFTMLMSNTYDAFAKLQTMASISAQLDYQGKVIPTTTTNHKASWILNAANIVAAEHVIVDNENGLKITTEPLSLGQVMPLSLIVVNDVESYSTVSW